MDANFAWQQAVSDLAKQSQKRAHRRFSPRSNQCSAKTCCAGEELRQQLANAKSNTAAAQDNIADLEDQVEELKEQLRLEKQSLHCRRSSP